MQQVHKSYVNYTKRVVMSLHSEWGMSDTFIIGLTGKKFSGKSTISQYAANKYGFKIESFADPLKKMVSEMFGWTDECYDVCKKESMTKWGINPRTALQIIGTDFVRDDIKKYIPELKMNHSSLWVQHMEHRLKNSTSDLIIIDDVRFEDECNMIKAIGGCIIEINSPDTVNLSLVPNAPKKIHASEQVPSIKDYQITNDWKNNKSTAYSQFDDIFQSLGRG